MSVVYIYVEGQRDSPESRSNYFWCDRVASVMFDLTTDKYEQHHTDIRITFRVPHVGVVLSGRMSCLRGRGCNCPADADACGRRVLIRSLHGGVE
jgi:hypothetical protein